MIVDWNVVDFVWYFYKLYVLYFYEKPDVP